MNNFMEKLEYYLKILNNLWEFMKKEIQKMDYGNGLQVIFIKAN